MKNVLLILVYSLGFYSLHSARLEYSTIDYTSKSYQRMNLDGFDFYIHKNVLAAGREKSSKTLDTYRFFFNKISLLLPDTVSKFKSKKYKIILLEENCDGFEVIKFGQSKWDNRHNKFTEGSIVVCKSIAYAKEAETDKYALFPYLVHEMMHVHHNEVLGYGFNWDIRKNFNIARRNHNYRNDDYVFHNFLEYWAEISTAYILDDGYNPKTTRPANSRWLYENDRLSYNLCVKYLGPKKAGYKPLESADNNRPEAPNPPKAPKAPIAPRNIDPVTGLELPNSRRKKEPFLEMYANLIYKVSDAEDEEFLVSRGIGCVDKAEDLYFEIYNLASDIMHYYPLEKSHSVKKHMNMASSMLDLK